MYINCYSTAILSTLVYLWLKELVISERILRVEERISCQVQQASSTKPVISFPTPFSMKIFSTILMCYVPIIIRVSTTGNQLKGCNYLQNSYQ